MSDELPTYEKHDPYCQKEHLPAFMIRDSELVNSYGDEWVNNYWYPIKFCPFCGERIDIKSERTEDKTAIYNSWSKRRDELWGRCRDTDSKKEERVLQAAVHELDDLMNSLHELEEYKGEQFD